jgi:hypothetical protein
MLHLQGQLVILDKLEVQDILDKLELQGQLVILDKLEEQGQLDILV